MATRADVFQQMIDYLAANAPKDIDIGVSQDQDKFNVSSVSGNVTVTYSYSTVYGDANGRQRHTETGSEEIAPSP